MVSLKQIGPYAYIAGVVLALILGFVAPSSLLWALILGLLGIVVGLLNITDKEVNTFLLASVAFIVSASSLSDLLVKLGQMLGMDATAMVGGGLASALGYMVAFTAPAAALIAVLALYRLAKD
ncbi:MAG: hypothetical protein QXU54_00290 [Candidatus Micrarchaeia archaeon]